MTAEMAAKVVVQWARLGKDQGDSGYRVLDCSNGPFSRAYFDGQLVRYSPGTLQPDQLPQVTVSWSRRRSSEANNSEEIYIAIAIYHPFLAEQRDISDRQVMPTDYFCAPYYGLADAEASYLTMYHEFSRLRLPRIPADPIPIALPLPEATILPDSRDAWLAQHTAALLLTERPVCVLGAAEIGMLDRLRFIDAVAALLPYGMRSNLSAATWVSSTNRQHKMRLFFSDADRENDDNVVIWRMTDDRPIDDQIAEDYRQLLMKGAFHPDLLSEDELRRPRGFDTVSVNTVVSLAFDASRRPRWPARRRRGGHAPAPEARPGRGREDDDQPAQPEPEEHAGVSLLTAGQRDSADDDRETEYERGTNYERGTEYERETEYESPAVAYSRSAGDPGELSRLREILDSCAQVLQLGQPQKLGRHIALLADFAHDDPPVLRRCESRDRIGKIIEAAGLLKPAGLVDDHALLSLYPVLLKLAFSTPVSYETYRGIERCAGYSPGQRLHEPLALTLLDVEVNEADPVRPLVMNSLGDAELLYALDKAGLGPDQPLTRLIDWLVFPKLREDPSYAQTVVNVVMRILLLREGRVSKATRLSFQHAIIQGKLMQVLQERHKGEPERLLRDIRMILRFAYGKSLALAEARKLMATAWRGPNDALHAALLTMVEPRARQSLVRDFYLRQLAIAGFSESERARLKALVVPRMKSARRRPMGPSAISQVKWHRDLVWRIILVGIAIAAIVTAIVISVFISHI